MGVLGTRLAPKLRSERVQLALQRIVHLFARFGLTTPGKSPSGFRTSLQDESRIPLTLKDQSDMGLAPTFSGSGPPSQLCFVLLGLSALVRLTFLYHWNPRLVVWPPTRHPRR